MRVEGKGHRRQLTKQDYESLSINCTLPDPVYGLLSNSSYCFTYLGVSKFEDAELTCKSMGGELPLPKSHADIFDYRNIMKLLKVDQFTSDKQSTCYDRVYSQFSNTQSFGSSGRLIDAIIIGTTDLRNEG